MNLQALSDQVIIESLHQLALKERALLTEFLHYLAECEKRRLYSALGYKSLFELCVKKFGYSEDQAHRRIQAMRLIKEIPEVEEKLNQGTLHLSHASLAQSFLKKEEKISQVKMDHQEKLHLIKQIEQQPIRAAEQFVMKQSVSPIQHRPDQVKPVSEMLIEMRFQAHESILEQIEILKGHYAHSAPDMSLGELFEKLCLEQVARVRGEGERVRKKNVSKKRKARAEEIRAETARPKSAKKKKVKHESEEAFREAAVDSDSLGTSQKRCVKMRVGPAATNAGTNSGTIERDSNHSTSQAAILRDVRRGAHQRCEQCGSTYALQTDHIKPRALGGSSARENLRLLCRSCNQRAAIEVFGMEKMESYLKFARR